MNTVISIVCEISRTLPCLPTCLSLRPSVCVAIFFVVVVAYMFVCFTVCVCKCLFLYLFGRLVLSRSDVCRCLLLLLLPV